VRLVVWGSVGWFRTATSLTSVTSFMTSRGLALSMDDLVLNIPYVPRTYFLTLAGAEALVFCPFFLAMDNPTRVSNSSLESSTDT
jgi:hypothetical protein